MITIEQNEKRKDDNLFTLTEIEAAGNEIITIRPTKGTLLTKRGETFTNHVKVVKYGNEYWEPINAHH